MTEHQIFNTTPLPVRLKVEDYLLLDEAGAFADYHKTELIDGQAITARTIDGLEVYTRGV